MTANKHILVVDDLKVNFLLIKAMLLRNGMLVSWAENGYEAIEIVKKETNLSAILMDYNMPGIDGLETTLIIKKLRPDLKVISHSTFTDTSSFDRSNAPFDDYLSKPIDCNQLISLLQKHLKQ
ncbi:MAG TPA: response regulator [Bacteroidales bacterium]|nr:response regulator [Bacteroidales bacterium]MDD4087316.1 response regulator [Bacteroidales bacterium]MDY0084494.1 response regulator [Bacteroidales bacterium]HPE42622.1 response regulator [Bacteroidales bacterium]